jgi:hypothetical protein
MFSIELLVVLFLVDNLPELSTGDFQMLKPTIATVLWIAALAVPVHARSCSDYKSICLSKGVKEAKCNGAWQRCMKTGNYTGPESGTNHGQADKN